VSIDAEKNGGGSPPKPLIVVLDSNILIKNYFFNTHDMNNLMEFARRTNSYIFLHEIVIEEIRGYIERNCVDVIIKANKNLGDLENWGAVEHIELNKEALIKKAISKFEETLLKVKSDRVILVPYNDSDSKEASRRLIKRIPPSSKKGEEFRDVMIWLNVIRFCGEKFLGSPVVFISTDKHFTDGKKFLKPQLIDDTRRYLLDFNFFPSLTEFLKMHSDPVNGIDRYWITSRVDIQSIKELVRRSGHLQKFEYYNKEQQIELENDAWTLILNKYSIVHQEKQELHLNYKVVIKKGIAVRHGRENVNNMRVELIGTIINDEISIEYLYSCQYDSI
jgi:rRNA-processing protein FCF1